MGARVRANSPADAQIFPLELLSFCINAAMSATVTPDTFALEFMTADIAAREGPYRPFPAYVW
jgi:hypothetical protein